MAMNRLHLDFNIISSEDRKEFVNSYLNPSLTGVMNNFYVDKYDKDKSPFPFPFEPTQEELETIANYILYGKTKSDKSFDVKDKKGNDGTQSVVDAGYIEIPTRNSPWNRKQEESLNSMMEISSETGNPIETQYNLVGGLNGKTPNERPRYRIPKETFSREDCRKALTEKDPFLLQQYEQLWVSIDVMEYTITSYELRIGKRKLAIREELENRLTQEQKDKARAHCEHLNMYTWSKLRKFLVELRQQQYMWRDSYAQPLLHHSPMKYTDSGSGSLQFTSILPCGTLNPNNEFLSTLFMTEISDKQFNKTFQTKLINFLNKQDKEIEADDSYGVFDFRNPDHIALFIYAKNELAPDDDSAALEDNEYLEHFLATLNYYVSVATLDPLHIDIIKMKTNGSRNEDIAAYINKTYKKTYSANYISTIFRAKCCGGIAEAATQHWAIIDKLSIGIEEFKKCNTCGKMLLRDANNYVRKTRASDGLAGRCKMCDKVARQNKKAEKEAK